MGGNKRVYKSVYADLNHRELMHYKTGLCKLLKY